MIDDFRLQIENQRDLGFQSSIVNHQSEIGNL